MIPKSEMRLLAETVSEAFTASAEGQRKRGMALLLQGLRRAITARERGEEWGAALEEHYRRSLGSYGQDFQDAAAEMERKAA
jgi:hypothetical protein